VRVVAVACHSVSAFVAHFFVCLGVLIFVVGVPNFLFLAMSRVDQGECLALNAKSPVEKSYLLAPHVRITAINFTLPNTLFYAQHVIRVREDRKVSRAEVTATVTASRRDNVKDLVVFGEMRNGAWNINFRNKMYILQKGCATLDVEIVLPIDQYDALNLNIPASAQVDMSAVNVKKININQRVANVKIPMIRGGCKRGKTPTPGKPEPLPTPAEGEVAIAHQHKRHGHRHHRHHEHKHHGHGIHRRILHWGRNKWRGRRPQIPTKPDPRFLELFAPKWLNFTKTSSDMTIKTHQKVNLKDYSCSNGQLDISALSVNATRVSTCNNIKIAATESYLNAITADKLEITGTESENTNIVLEKMTVKHVVGNLINGKFKMTPLPSTIVDVEKKKVDGELNVNLNGIVWFRNSDLVKQGKWKCEGECVQDVKVTLANKGSIQISE